MLNVYMWNLHCLLWKRKFKTNLSDKSLFPTDSSHICMYWSTLIPCIRHLSLLGAKVYSRKLQPSSGNLHGHKNMLKPHRNACRLGIEPTTSVLINLLCLPAITSSVSTLISSKKYSCIFYCPSWWCETCAAVRITVNICNVYLL